MKRHLLLFLFAGILQYSFANPVSIQKLILKNGSELEGYISMQRPGTNFTFTTARAIIYMQGKSIKSIAEQEINIKQLSPAWIKWAEENDAFVGLGDNRSLTLSDIVTEDKTISKVRILEKGAQIKYLEMSVNTYSLNWDTIALIKAEKRPKTALTGINRIYKLDNGQEYEGEYVQEVPGKTLSLYRPDGVIEVFETAKVVKYSMRKINPNQSLFEQSCLVDIVKLKNGTDKRGIIIEQNFSNNTAGNYLLIENENGSTQSIKSSEIAEYRKEVNPAYKPQFDILLKPGELVINRKPTQALEIEEAGSYIILPEDSCLIEIESKSPMTPIVVETHLSTTGNPYELVKVKNLHDKKSKKDFKGFSYQDIVKNNIQPISHEVSLNQTTKLEYKIAEKGMYVIYNPKEKTAILFLIK